MAFSESVAARGFDPAWNRWMPLILAMADEDVSRAALFMAIIATESAWVELAVNPADPSYGLMQVQAGPKGPYPGVASGALLDGATNIVLGTRFMLGLLSRHTEHDAISAYNQGEGSLARRGIINQPYLDSVQTYQVWYVNNWPSETIDGQDSVTAPTDTPTTVDERPSGGSVNTAQFGGGIMILALVAFVFFMGRGQ